MTKMGTCINSNEIFRAGSSAIDFTQLGHGKVFGH